MARFIPSGADISMQILLDFPGEIRSIVACSFEAPFQCRVELVGTRGMMTIPDAFLPPPEAQLVVRHGTDRESPDETIVFPAANQYAEQVRDFCASIAAGRLLPPAEEGVANMQVLEQALQMAQKAAAGG
jgi:predicted dehydrogenase